LADGLGLVRPLAAASAPPIACDCSVDRKASTSSLTPDSLAWSTVVPPSQTIAKLRGDQPPQPPMLLRARTRHTYLRANTATAWSPS
jgi:hypothetical protein